MILARVSNLELIVRQLGERPQLISKPLCCLQDQIEYAARSAKPGVRLLSGVAGSFNLPTKHPGGMFLTRPTNKILQSWV